MYSHTVFMQNLKPCAFEFSLYSFWSVGKGTGSYYVTLAVIKHIQFFLFKNLNVLIVFIL